MALGRHLARLRLVLGLALTVIVLAAVLPTPAAGRPAAADPPVTDPDPGRWQRKAAAKVLGALETAGRADFVIRFAERAELTGAGGVRNWAERGRLVTDRLRDTADRSQRDVRAQLDAAGARYRPFWITNSIVVTAGGADLAAAIAGRPEVAALAEVPRYEAPDLDLAPATQQAGAVEWGLADIHADQVWDQYGARGAGLVIGNIDTGVQFDHPALAAQYRGRAADGTVSHDYHWFDPSKVCPTAAPCDNIFHGTHTMGTMVGGDGPTGRIGVAPEARWIAAKGCEDEERGCSLAALLASGEWMLAPTDQAGRNPRPELRPHIVNNSWGASNNGVEDPFYDEVVAAWEAAGMFAVFSNGNDGRLGCDTSGSPADGAAAYAVGAHDRTGTAADFSSRGPGGPGDLKPDVSAPGVAIRSAVPGDRFGDANGTSMAAPHVAGAVALLWSAAPDLKGDTATTRELLGQTAIDTADLSCGGTAAVNNVYGEGRLDALAALRAAPIGATGRIAGKITATSGTAIAGAKVTATTADRVRTTTTRADGSFELLVSVSTYALTATAYGFESGTVSGLQVAEGQTVTATIQLTAVPMATVTGRITDGSGQGWPLYAKLVVDGAPLAPVYSSPGDGAFSFQVATGSTYKLSVRSEYGGYQPLERELVVGTADQRLDLQLPVVQAPCTAAGYRIEDTGLRESFDSEPAGWTSTKTIGDGWRFDDPGKRNNLTGGSGGFASIDSGTGVLREDGTLVSPAVDLRAVETPSVEFRSDFLGSRATVELDLSVDGGGTWQNVWRRTSALRGPQQLRVPIPAAAGRQDVRVRFRYVNALSGNGWWQLDDVVIGLTKCVPVSGGLVFGTVRGGRPVEPVDGAEVGAIGRSTVLTRATPDDPGLTDGFYALFLPLGRTSLTARYEAGQLEERTAAVDPASGQAVRADFLLGTAELVVSPATAVSKVRLDKRRTVDVTVKNVGTGRARFALSEFAPPKPLEVASSSQPGTGTVRREPVADDGGPRPEHDTAQSTARPTAEQAEPAEQTKPAGQTKPVEQTEQAGPWLRRADLAWEDLDQLAAVHDGKLYAIGGWGGRTPSGQEQHRYDPGTDSWSRIAPSVTPRAKAAGGFVAGKLYAVGGWSRNSVETASTEIYDPATDRWSAGPDAPVATAAAGHAVVGSRLYLVGGRTPAAPERGSRAVQVLDTTTNKWSLAADYPEAVSWAACGTIQGRIYCAGGQDGGARPLRTAYTYHPETNRWFRIADLPRSVWGAGFSAANGNLLVSGGVVAGYRSNEGFRYDPSTDAWSALPLSNFALTRSAGACGFYKVAGSEGQHGNRRYVEQLPGFTDCAPGTADVAWLTSSLTTAELAPGESRRIRLTLEAGAVPTGQPGRFTAQLLVHENTPFQVKPVTITLDAVPPPSWGRLTGTVTGVDHCATSAGTASGTVRPVAGASVVLDGRRQTVSLATDTEGRYGHWLDVTESPVRVIASKPGWSTDQELTVVRPGRDTRVDLRLTRRPPCGDMTDTQPR